MNLIYMWIYLIKIISLLKMYHIYYINACVYSFKIYIIYGYILVHIFAYSFINSTAVLIR